MQAPIRCALIAGMLLACDTGDTTTPTADAPDVPGDSGLVVEWSSAPSAWPSTTNNVTLTRARFGLKSLRVVGDAGPGDPRTTASALEMGFAWSGAEERPSSIPFDDAPPGLYSQVALVFDALTSDGDAYELRGMVEVSGEDYEFRIEDNNPLTFNVAIDEMLSPGEQAAIRLRINFTHALDSIDWQNVDTSDGRKELDNGDSQMSTFRAKLIESFEIVSVGSVR
jgi:hypothetical protein